jgi:hypothetical protein
MARFSKINANRIYVNSDLVNRSRSIDNRGDLLSTTCGAGAIGTAFTPRTYRWTENGHIITEYHVDLTGLACKGDAANDVIGLSTGGAAYLDQYVVANHGVVYKVEVACLEAPGQGTATITTDIDIAFNTSAALAYDGAAGAAECNLGGLAAGAVYTTTAPALTTTDYMYLVEGDTAATTGVYNAGMLVIRMYGHAVLA